MAQNNRKIQRDIKKAETNKAHSQRNSKHCNRKSINLP